MKKILFGVVAALAVAVILAGCSGIGVGEGDLKGGKWKAELNVNNKDDLKDEEKTGVPLYKRYFEGFGASENCYELKTTITIDTSAVSSKVYSDGAADPKFATVKDATYATEKDVEAVVGLFFDAHQKGTGKNATYDFAVFGYQPGKNRFYIERYYGVKATDLATFDADGKKTFGTTNLTTPGGTEDKFENIDEDTGGSGWVSCDTGFALTTGQTEKKITVTITQAEKGVYKISFDGKAGKEYTYNAKNVEWGTKSVEGKATTNKDGYNTGSIWAYANVPLNTKVKALYENDKKATKGLFAEEAE